jgi:predicted RNase H-like HicB family nuclease
MKQYVYTVTYELAEEGVYVVHVPALNGLTTEGDNFEEAKTMAKDAIKGYLETLRELNLPIPDNIK